MRRLGFLILPFIAACSESPTGNTGSDAGAAPEPGALVDVSMTSQVGVLLDELPAAMRDRVAAELLVKPDPFWIERARRQVALATYRLVFRQFYYDEGKRQLPLPPDELRRITLTSAPSRQLEGGHDTVVVGYRFDTTILTDVDSIAEAEPALAVVGGGWDEPMSFPVDPELLLQRTGHACMDEVDFPLGSVDSEEVDTFYDDTCEVEDVRSTEGCHLTELPSLSCLDALDEFVGKVDVAFRFTRIAWDAARADQVRVGDLTAGGADLEVYLDDFTQNRVEYQYFEPDACELIEQCVGGPGWRRVLQFHTSDQNLGSETLDIGAVDYYLTGDVTLNDQYNIFELSDCHQHYHFTHYGEFAYAGPGAASTVKQGFCLQSTDRIANHELSPITNPYGSCDYQGVEAGWVDQYKMGLPCQWVDVTEVDTSAGPVTAPLTFTSNPDGFLCEGEPMLDAMGKPVFEMTDFTTDDGEPVWRPVCAFKDGWFDNNQHSYDATVPAPGESFINRACSRGQLGPLRNCGFAATAERPACDAGQPASLHCEVAAGGAPQVVRLCEVSQALGVGLACRAEGALASVVIDGAGDVAFSCPAARSSVEPGGVVSLYTAPAYDGDPPAAVTCAIE